MEKSVMEAGIEFFGLHEGQTRMQLGKEINTVFPNGTPAREELIAGIEKATGWTIKRNPAA